MSAIPELTKGAVEDLRALVRQYMELASLKAKDSARSAIIALALFATSFVLAVVTVAELIGALAIRLVDRQAGEVARMAAVAGLLTLLVAGVLAFIATRFVKRIDVDPRLSKDRSLTGSDPLPRTMEDRTWQPTT